jgi:hypothetical protein
MMLRSHTEQFDITDEELIREAGSELPGPLPAEFADRSVASPLSPPEVAAPARPVRAPGGGPLPLLRGRRLAAVSALALGLLCVAIVFRQLAGPEAGQPAHRPVDIARDRPDEPPPPGRRPVAAAALPATAVGSVEPSGAAARRNRARRAEKRRAARRGRRRERRRASRPESGSTPPSSATGGRDAAPAPAPLSAPTPGVPPARSRQAPPRAPANHDEPRRAPANDEFGLEG